MKREFKAALEKGRILSFKDGPKLVQKELVAAKQDFEEVKDRFSNDRFKYATIIAYYSMFHAARALLYSRGYREKSHHFLSVALEVLFVDTGSLLPQMARAFKNAMLLREEADYHSEFSKEGAQVAIQSAEEFYKKAKEILKL